jgi:hypothetical protein
MTRAFKLFPRLKGAAGHSPDSSENGSEPELEVMSIPRLAEASLLFPNPSPSPYPSFESTGILCTYY